MTTPQRPSEAAFRACLSSKLDSFHQLVRPLPGIQLPGAKNSLVRQLEESDRRVRFIRTIAKRAVHPDRRDPHSPLFDPIRAAILNKATGDLEEAFWNVFLSVHFGKHRTGGWRLAAIVYGRGGAQPIWDWPNISQNTAAFRTWLDSNQAQISEMRQGAWFGNHRKRQTITDTNTRGTGTGDIVDSYINWVRGFGSQQAAFASFTNAGATPATDAFDKAFESMSAVTGFGRTAKFDYLTMVHKLDLAPIQPSRLCIPGSTGPVKGARLLLGMADATKKQLDIHCTKLAAYIGVTPDILEDALCNWQKSPTSFKPYRG